jgi:predicted DNA-binding protein (UPF0251 family)
MRQPYRRRRIDSPPRWTRFKPAGTARRRLGRTVLSVDEYEAIRLSDHVGLDHLEASRRMGISRPTFTRVVEKARHKVAESLVEGRELIISGGNFSLVRTLFLCRDCGDVTPSHSDFELNACPECESDDLEDLSHRIRPDGAHHTGETRR